MKNENKKIEVDEEVYNSFDEYYDYDDDYNEINLVNIDETNENIHNWRDIYSDL